MERIESEKVKFKNKLNELQIDEKLRRYFETILNGVYFEYDLARNAKKRGPDISPYPESKLVWDMADRVEHLIDLPGVADFIRENKRLSREHLALKAIDELILGSFGNFSMGELVDIGVRLPLAILTEGMTVAPTEGIRKVVIKTGRFGNYLSIYYSGPIRSAGGTETGLSVIYADYLRKKLNIGRYYPSKLEIHRFIEEIRLYEKNVSRFQYTLSDEVLYYILSNLPVEVTGIATDDVEVLSYRDVPGIETNQLRGGALRVVNDGLGGKAKKLVKIVSELRIEDWNWLRDITTQHVGNSIRDHYSDKVLNELVMGRPVFSLRSSNRGLRLRYAREPHIGISALGLNPATFAILDYFIVVGSQIKLNLPGKGGIAVASKLAFPPIVELESGDIVEVTDELEANKIKDHIKKILFLGDIIISYGDFLENNHPLMPSHYSPEWWVAELSSKIGRRLNVEVAYNIDYSKSVEYSHKYNIPLNPLFVPSFEFLSLEEARILIKSLSDEYLEGEKDYICLHYDKKLYGLLRKSRIPLVIDDEGDKIIIRHRYANLLNDLVRGYKSLFLKPPTFSKAEDLFSFYLGYRIRLLKGTYVSARLGRPEKAKMRELSPPTHVLFPIGEYGGSQRDIIKAISENTAFVLELSILKCPYCGRYTYENICSECGIRTVQAYYCRNCKKEMDTLKCSRCGENGVASKYWNVDIGHLYNSIISRYNISTVKRLKGVKGLLNYKKRYEDLSKGILRSRHKISVFKDGTCRIDITNAPLDKVRLSDIKLSVDKARELGYDVENHDDVIDIFPMDIIIPESVGDKIVDICKFIDEELEKIYGLSAYYKVKDREDLIGKLVVGLSPHTSSGVIGRIIGFSKANVLYAHPLWHAAKRRDCDGDQDAIMMLMDVFLNFSREYLPSSSGGRMDAPLFITIIIHPEEVDTQVHNLDITDNYPPELFKESQNEGSPKVVKSAILTVEDVLGNSRSYYRYGSFINVPQLNIGASVNQYSKLGSMDEKLEKQLLVMDRIFDENEKSTIVENLLKNHVIRDIMGNLRSFFQQRFVCKKCGASYRRITLSGNCIRCNMKLSPTVHIKSVTKYMSHARKLVEHTKSNFVRSYIALIESIIDSTFELSESGGITIYDFIWSKTTQQSKTDQSHR